MSHERIPVPRAAVERLRELAFIRDRADAEARGLMAGLASALAVPVDQVVGFDDGEEPALLLAPAEPQPPPEP